MTLNRDTLLQSGVSGRLIVPGWEALARRDGDKIEIQLNLARDQRPHAVLLLEWWPDADTLQQQTVITYQAVLDQKEGFCVQVPALGQFQIRTVDGASRPPQVGVGLFKLALSASVVKVDIFLPPVQGAPLGGRAR